MAYGSIVTSVIIIASTLYFAQDVPEVSNAETGGPDKPETPAKAGTDAAKPDKAPLAKTGVGKTPAVQDKDFEWEDTDKPAYDQIQDFQKVANKAGVPLTEAEAEEALRAGAFTKGENTYRILKNDATPTEFKIEKVGKTSPLDDLAPNFDKTKPEYAGAAPGAYDPSYPSYESPYDTQEPQYSPYELAQAEQIVQAAIDDEFGVTDRYGRSIPGSGSYEFAVAVAHTGLPIEYFIAGCPNPFPPGTHEYDDFNRVASVVDRALGR